MGCLDKVVVAAPCAVSWDSMRGDDLRQAVKWQSNVDPKFVASITSDLNLLQSKMGLLKAQRK